MYMNAELMGLHTDGINQRTEAAFGYPSFGYMYFFNESSAAATIENNVCPSKPQCHT